MIEWRHIRQRLADELARGRVHPRELEVHTLADVDAVVEEVAMRERAALRGPRRAARELDVAHVVPVELLPSRDSLHVVTIVPLHHPPKVSPSESLSLEQRFKGSRPCVVVVDDNDATQLGARCVAHRKERGGSERR